MIAGGKLRIKSPKYLGSERPIKPGEINRTANQLDAKLIESSANDLSADERENDFINFNL